MSIDTTFKPIGATALVGVTAVQVCDKGAYLGVITFRVRCVNAAAQYLTWGSQSGVASAGAPTAGSPVQNTIGMAPGAVAYLDVPAASYFISGSAASFEVTGGTGGTGG